MKSIVWMILYTISCVAPNSKQSEDTTKVRGNAYISLVDVQNDIYAIKTDDKKIYLPSNLESAYKRDGLKIYFEGTIDTARLANVRLPGLPITIDKIKRR